MEFRFIDENGIILPDWEPPYVRAVTNYINAISASMNSYGNTVIVNPVAFEGLSKLVASSTIQKSERAPAERPKKKQSTLPSHFKPAPAWRGQK
jgi:hypothetical protein